MSMAPVAAMTSGTVSAVMYSKIQSIAWPGPAMKPSSDITLFTTTLPVKVSTSLIRLSKDLGNPGRVLVRPGGEGKGESCTRIRGGATRTKRHPDVLARSVAYVLGYGVNDPPARSPSVLD